MNLLDTINASKITKSAYCVHPIFQVPDSLKQAFINNVAHTIEPNTLLLAMEYRNKANAYVCRPYTDNYELKDLPHMVIPEVTEMLIADKVQNYKDFLQYHANSHPRAEQLKNYFNLWFQHLDIKYEDYKDTLYEN